MAYGRISLEQVLNSEDFYQLPKMIIKAGSVAKFPISSF